MTLADEGYTGNGTGVRVPIKRTPNGWILTTTNHCSNQLPTARCAPPPNAPTPCSPTTGAPYQGSLSTLRSNAAADQKASAQALSFTALTAAQPRSNLSAPVTSPRGALKPRELLQVHPWQIIVTVHCEDFKVRAFFDI